MEGITTIGKKAFGQYFRLATVYCVKNSAADDISLYPDTCIIKDIALKNEQNIDSDKGDFDELTDEFANMLSNLIVNTLIAEKLEDE